MKLTGNLDKSLIGSLLRSMKLRYGYDDINSGESSI